MKEMEKDIRGAPQAREFLRGGDIEFNKFHTALHKFLWRLLQETKKRILAEKLRPTTPPKNTEDNTQDEEE
jgi:hypothetical protein